MVNTDVILELKNEDGEEGQVTIDVYIVSDQKTGRAKEIAWGGSLGNHQLATEGNAGCIGMVTYDLLVKVGLMGIDNTRGKESDTDSYTNINSGPRKIKKRRIRRRWRKGERFCCGTSLASHLKMIATEYLYQHGYGFLFNDLTKPISEKLEALWVNQNGLKSTLIQ